MAKEKKDKHFIKQPVYVGGPKALKKFIGENIKYPKAAAENNIEGTVVVRYTINHKGVVIEGKVISGIGHGCNEEAKRLVKLLKFEVPKHRGIKVKFHKNIKIHFRKPKKKPKPKQASQQLSYMVTVTNSKKTESDASGNPPSKPGKSYHYTINF